MHDINKQQAHAQIPHRIHTPTTKHVEIIKQIAKQDAALTGKSLRRAIESQMLQNPSLNKLESVAGLTFSIISKFLSHKKK